MVFNLNGWMETRKEASYAALQVNLYMLYAVISIWLRFNISICTSFKMMCICLYILILALSFIFQYTIISQIAPLNEMVSQPPTPASAPTPAYLLWQPLRIKPSFFPYQWASFQPGRFQEEMRLQSFQLQGGIGAVNRAVFHQYVLFF